MTVIPARSGSASSKPICGSRRTSFAGQSTKPISRATSSRLLFFKRICDVYDEEFQEALDESDGDVDYASFAENHRFQVPEGAHWNDLRERAENVGQALQTAMREH